MSKPTNEELEKELETLQTNFNQAVQIQKNCQERAIAIRAILADRTEEEEDN